MRVYQRSNELNRTLVASGTRNHIPETRKVFENIQAHQQHVAIMVRL